MSASSERPPSHFHWLDLVRFAAALMVVIVHCRGLGWVEYGALPPEQKNALMFGFYSLTRIGAEAVNLFFVLSGFLVGGKAIERMMAGQFRLGDYVIDRISRLYLPLLPALGVSALVALYTKTEMSLGSFVGNVFGLQGITTEPFAQNGPLWSLAYEMWFYVLAAAIAVAAARRGLHLRAAIVIILVASLFTVLEPTYLFCWTIGALAYVKRPERPSILLSLGGLALCMYGTVGVELGMDSRSLQNLAIAKFVPSHDVSHLILAFGGALIIQQLILRAPRPGVLAAIERAGTPLSAFSYTLYLVHYPIVKAITYAWGERMPRVDAKAFGYLALLIAASVLGSVILYFLFERHTPVVRRTLRAWWQRSSGPGAAKDRLSQAS